MITSRPTFGLLLATSFLLCSSGFSSIQAEQRRTSVVAQAATGQWNDADVQFEQPPLARTGIQPAGYRESYGSNCGPVCDCGNCDAACGAEVAFGDDPGCGIEVGCGMGVIEGAMPSEPWIGGCDSGCCGAGCDSGCCDSGCCDSGCCDSGCCDSGCCDSGCDSGCCDSGCDLGIPILLPRLGLDWCSIDVMWGHQGFTGPLNYVNTDASNPGVRSGNGSFGLYQGFNKGTSLRNWLGCNVASQFGIRTTQSNLSGAGYTRERRYQVFVTGGLFRRVDYGLQLGLVFDYLNQDWYFQGDAVQTRGEISWRCESCETFGFQFMAGLRSESSGTVVFDGNGNRIISTIRMQPTDQARLFYRRPISNVGNFTTYAGWTDRSDALLGTNLELPIFRRLLLTTDLTYLIPDQGRSNLGNEEEAWNVSVGFIFRPGGSSRARRYNVPMFNVADNGSFLIDRR